MSRQSHAKSLATLIGLRAREVDRLLAELAAKEAERARYRANLARMAQLVAGPSGSAAAPLSRNFGEYKEGVLQLAETHRHDLAQHESRMAVTRVALLDATRRHEVLGKVLAAEQQRGQRSKAQREQKQQDEQAVHWWTQGLRARRQP